jgi:hypothetical protein
VEAVGRTFFYISIITKNGKKVKRIAKKVSTNFQQILGQLLSQMTVLAPFGV